MLRTYNSNYSVFQLSTISMKLHSAPLPSQFKICKKSNSVEEHCRTAQLASGITDGRLTVADTAAAHSPKVTTKHLKALKPTISAVAYSLTIYRVFQKNGYEVLFLG